MVSIATPYPIFTAINSNIYRQGLNSAAVHGVEKRHVLCASHPRAVEPGLFVILSWMRRLDVDVRAIFYRKFLDYFNLLGIVDTTAAPAVILFFSAYPLLQSIISLDILAILFS